MTNADRISQRFKELELLGESISISRRSDGGNYVDSEEFQQFASSAMQLVSATFGEGSPHYRNLERAYSRFSGWADAARQFRGVFLAAKSDFDGGHLYNLESRLTGEVFADFVSAAKSALVEGQKDVAAVLASAALEDALKRFAERHDIVVDGKSMQDVIGALKAGGLVSGPQKSLLEPMPRIRDAAMHANWSKITQQDVGSLIGYVEQFLMVHFG